MAGCQVNYGLLITNKNAYTTPLQLQDPLITNENAKITQYWGTQNHILLILTTSRAQTNELEMVE